MKYRPQKKYAPTPKVEEALPPQVVEEGPEVEAPSSGMVRSESGPVDRGLVRPEWAAKVDEVRAERAVQGPRVPKRASLAPSWWEALWAPFEIFREEPSEEESSGSLEEELIPDSERAYVERRRQESSRGAAPERPSYARGAAPERPSYARAAEGRPSYERAAGSTPEKSEAQPATALADMVTPAYVDQVFDLQKVFDHVREIKLDPKFDGSVGIGTIAPTGIDPWGKVLETAKFFGVDEAAWAGIPREKVWDDVFGPFLAAVIKSLNTQKPADLPGTFVFGTSPRGAFGLIYTEAK